MSNDTLAVKGFRARADRRGLSWALSPRGTLADREPGLPALKDVLP